MGRDNEPIYLRGDLCDCVSLPTSTSPSPSASASNTTGERSPTDQRNGNEIDKDSEKADEDSSQRVDGATSKRGRGLLGRIKGVLGGTVEAAQGGEGKDEAVDDSRDFYDDDDDDTDDPFGFFECSTSVNESSKPQVAIGNSAGFSSPMSLTQQLVLHASLDRFEEMASSSSKSGAVRWRKPGSTGANAMWMGLLCEVEERWTVYGVFHFIRFFTRQVRLSRFILTIFSLSKICCAGYLTNTGIKFMILVENIYLNEQGLRHDHAKPSFANPFPHISPIFFSSNAPNREGDLKVMFVSGIQ